MPSTLPQVLFQSNGENWIEILILKAPEGTWDLRKFMLAISEAVQERIWMCYLVAEAWYEGWYGEAGYKPGSQAQAEPEANFEELKRRVQASRT